MFYRMFALYLYASVYVINSALSAQTVADLESPSLKLNANLPQYFRAGPSISQLLSEAHEGATSKGIPWKGLDFFVFDADKISGFTDSSAEKIYLKLSCSADMIAMGHISSSASHLSTYGLVYSDYIFVIDHLFLDKQVPGSPGGTSTSKSSIIVPERGAASW